MRASIPAWAFFLGAIVFALSPYFGIPAWTLTLATLVSFTAISLVGLNLIYGLTGMLSLGHAAFFAWPVYLGAILYALGLPWLISIPLALVIAIALAGLLGLIFIRLPGMYFAIGSLGFAFVTEGLARAFPSLTGGASGLVLVSAIRLEPEYWYALSLIALAVSLLIYRRLTVGGSYRTLKLIRYDELSSEVLGINVARVKLRIFIIGSAYAAVSGVFMAFFVGIIVPESGGVNMSLEYLSMTVIGGAGFLFGPVLGAVLVQWLFAIAGAADEYELLIYGLAFFLVVLYAPQGLSGLIASWWRKAVRSRTASGPVHLTLNADIDDEVRPSPATRPPGTTCLEVSNISKRFGGLVAVSDVSLTVCHGQIVALLGPNGAGKSTLFNLISGIERPDTGKVSLQGHDLSNTPIFKRATKAGRSFQTPRLVPEMTVLQNVAMRLDNLSGSQHEAEINNTAYRQLIKYGLEKYANEPVHKVSIGSHKLIDVARASIGSPPLLLLDEPAVGLTEDEVSHLATMLNKLRSTGAAILLVEHNFEFVKSVADSVVVLDGGNVIAAGSVEDVMRSSKVQEAYFGALT
ncbi:ATP-binding cassette domain-containing protein [Pusillimonas noertemannii]|uniref:Amino acid/amide ABC transporter membrane protein 2 (HAAT family) /amino acid/amide ABC transporter ATP-binding protein 1 (HAAT family) n=1 Tax=Pusillimonas noertemannii TaxID=305977 RepID=A0A2U1CQV5_9BURK|nr:ATP-binding cassette domain-containing protein [Pusillimonas noertemannii]NYT67594.1 ATP-binding cassette domain-containing protein [Pusillimonas noertemannii]PVY68266.1 amino acid/amide ABC transporter membrane protein 2 (HAAT family) /amino acid/amide ABC transporter ATP-binding protein 1 (HAAT family) [Pusillimonas noertemannii]